MDSGSSCTEEKINSKKGLHIKYATLSLCVHYIVMCPTYHYVSDKSLRARQVLFSLLIKTALVQSLRNILLKR